MANKLFFQAIKEPRGEYFVEYQPPVADHDFATLSLVFPNAGEPSQAADFMELELRRWLARYPVPLMVSAFDGSGSLLRVKGNGDRSHLVGWTASGNGEVSCSWNIDDLTAHLNAAPPNADWRTTYSDVSFKTETQIAADASKYARIRRRQILVLKIVLVLWLAAIPAGVAIFEFFSPAWLALILLCLALWEAWRTACKIWGLARATASERAEAERQRKMEHYYFHCERNPKGFARLMAENLEKDMRERIQKEAAEIKGSVKHGEETSE
jgi:hypothetical protein